MSDINEVISLYKSSSFYKKYRDTYFSDIILRDALKCKISIHRYYGLNKMSMKMCIDYLLMFYGIYLINLPRK